MTKFPCKGCEDRFVITDDAGKTTSCHATCEKYIEAYNKNAKLREEIRKKKSIERRLNDEKYEKIREWEKKRRGRPDG